MQAGDGPSYDELAALVEKQARVIQAQAEQIAALNKRVAELERRLGMNSGNSSMPPSSDRFSRPQPKSLRDKSGRKPGRQKGEPGSALQCAVPDEVFDHYPDVCRGCDGDLSGATVTGAYRVLRQIGARSGGQSERWSLHQAKPVRFSLPG